MNISATDKFKNLLDSTLSEGSFLKLTLSKPANSELPQNIYAKAVQLKKGKALSCTLRYATKDITQNFYLGIELDNQVDTWLGKSFKIATLITEGEETVLQFNNKGEAQIRYIKNQTDKKAQVLTHNKEKNYLIEEHSKFLQLLGVSSKEGKVYNDQQDKFRQINKYCEIMSAQLGQANLIKNCYKALKIVDMGSGKGYLTFALYDLIKNQLGRNVEMLGVELRTELCDFCNKQSASLEWNEGLRFAAMDILSYNEGDIDVLIALHACDIATDIAIAQGIRNGAELIVVAPCCHKQIRKEMKPQGPWTEILKQGILMERQAELITDALRALLLQKWGYKTKVFEFISTQHTPKNVMIAAVKSNAKMNEGTNQIEKDIQGLKDTFGISEHYLEKLLKG